MKRKIKFARTTDNRLQGWRYITNDHMITIPSRLMGCGDVSFLPESLRQQYDWQITDVFCLLHEQGHAHYGHAPEKNPYLAKWHEKQAWQYAESCLQIEYHAHMWEFANQTTFKEV